MISLADQAFALYEEGEQVGICLKCRHLQPAPHDALKDKCEACGEYEVYSPSETLMRITL